MTRPVPDITPGFVKAEEGCVLRVYDDARPKVVLRPNSEWVGTLTAGYGHTSPSLKPGQIVTQAQADAWLKEDLETAARAVERNIGPVVNDLTDHQYAALISFCFNLGQQPTATLWKVLKRRDYDAVPMELMKFDKARVGPVDPKTGKRKLMKLQGLVNRRTAEVRLWSTAEPGSTQAQFTSGAMRLMDTPATPSDPTPARKSATIWLAITAAVGGFLKWLGDLLASIPEFAQTALNAINPFADKSEIAQLIANGVGGLAAVAGLYVADSTLRRKKEARS